MLVPEAGSRQLFEGKGFTKPLFADVRKDSWILRVSVPHWTRTFTSIGEEASLWQISSAWNTREGTQLGRNRDVLFQIKKAKTFGWCNRGSMPCCHRMALRLLPVGALFTCAIVMPVIRVGRELLCISR